MGHIKSHKAICSSTISRWLKEILTLAGIDSSILKGYPTRSPSTFKAEVSGVLMSDIMMQGHWPKGFTFYKFYRKEKLTRSSSFESKVTSKKF